MLERRLPRRLDSLPVLFAPVRESLAAGGLDESRAFALDLVAEELFTNLVRDGDDAQDVMVTTRRMPFLRASSRDLRQIHLLGARQ